DLQQQRARAAGRVVDGRVRGRLRLPDAEQLRHHAAHFRGRVELPLALAALGSEVPHQVLVGVAEDVVAVGAVLREVECGVLEDRDQVGQPVDHLSLPLPSFVSSAKSGIPESLFACSSGPSTSLLMRSPMSFWPFIATMSANVAPFGMVIGAYFC